MINYEQLADLLAKDQELVRELTPQVSAQEALALLSAHGIQMTTEEFRQFLRTMKQAVKVRSGELSEEDLEDVAGGGSAWNQLTSRVRLGMMPCPFAHIKYW